MGDVAGAAAVDDLPGAEVGVAAAGGPVVARVAPAEELAPVVGAPDADGGHGDAAEPRTGGM